jgi:hypothetical protein
MSRRRIFGWLRSSAAALLCLSLAGCGGLAAPAAVGEAAREAVKPVKPGSVTYADPTGQLTIYSPAGPLDLTNPFFQSLGSNGRTCASCHVPATAFTITPSEVQARFNATTPAGTDPIFRPVDGTVSPEADVSTEAARRTAYAMLLQKGLIRVGIGIPANAEFALTAVDDPYGFASAAQLSLFRRPPPSTNLRFLSTVMWDGRETFPGEDLTFDLGDQVIGATLGHAQGQAAPTDAQVQQIVAFELGTYTAQTYDNAAKDLTTPRQAVGGPQPLATQAFHLGINDVFGGDPTPGTPAFDPAVFHLYDGWAGGSGGGTDAARNAVARGQALFNGRAIHITGVAGLNDALGQPDFVGTCSSCHDSPNAGSHSLAAPLDIGVADGARRTPDLPLYTLTNLATGQSVTTTDPGRALITGKWVDIGKFKGPTLRALAARPPYFHNGSAATLADVVAFYDQRFGIGLSAGDQSDLVAFLGSL